jgi:hypothetical protein
MKRLRPTVRNFVNDPDGAHHLFHNFLPAFEFDDGKMLEREESS